MAQNCLGYVLGLTGISTAEVHERTFELENPDPVKSFSKKLHELGYSVTTVFPDSPSLEADQTLIAFWGLFPYVDKLMGCPSYVYDFHVARQEPNGNRTHKWGWNHEPETTTIDFLNSKYRSTPYFFAIRKKTP